MPRFMAVIALLMMIGLSALSAIGQTSIDASRFRALREKARTGSPTAAEQEELDAAMAARGKARPAPSTTRPTTPAKSEPGQPETAPATPQSRDELRQKRTAEYAERQEFVFERSRQMGKDALAAAEKRQAQSGPVRQFYVNNETGNDSSDGLAPQQAVRTLAKAVSMLQPGDTLHLAVTNQPYRESLRLGDDFGGVPGKPIVIEGHGATITGSDPLRLDGWIEAGVPGLYKSAKFLSELEEFTDESKLMRVFFIFDGVMQNMGRSSKGNHSRLKAPADLQPGEWTYVEADQTFYLKVGGNLADAKIEVPYRRNGVTIRSPKVALTHVVIKDLIVCHVLNDGWNLHGTTQNLLLKNIAAYECGDDGISPHETCEVTIDGYWAVGNSTGMANGNLSVTKASNVRLEGNTAHQFMTGHAPVTELSNAVIIASPGTQAINVTNSQDTRLTLDNVQISGPPAQMPAQKVINISNSRIVARRVTSDGTTWENGGTVELIDSQISGPLTNFPGGTSQGDLNGLGAIPAEFKIPPRPVPHPAAGKFTTLVPLTSKISTVR